MHPLQVLKSDYCEVYKHQLETRPQINRKQNQKVHKRSNVGVFECDGPRPVAPMTDGVYCGLKPAAGNFQSFGNFVLC